MIVWRDGDFVPAETAISAEDRAFLVGDSIFETILALDGVPAFLDQHLARLRRGAAVMNFEARIEPRALRSAIADLAARRGVEGRAACRLTLSRVGGARGLAPSAKARTQHLVSVTPVGAPPKSMTVMIAGTRRWASSPTNAFKCGGAYAPNLIARAEAAARGADEAIMLNEHGRVACASAGNIFVVTADRIQTPPAGEGAMPGVVRAVLLEEARAAGLRIDEAPVEPEMLRASTVLVTNSIVGVVNCAVDGATAEARQDAANRLIEAYGRRLDREFASGARTGR
ncbi:MAG: aminotransferase class IV [Parvularculaceae bacterium]|nr:aminotransferase class IV [Parvularculaceae bacterium]